MKEPTDDDKQRIQLQKQVEELRCFNEELSAENEMFKEFIRRCDQQKHKYGVDPQQKSSSLRSILSQPRELTIEQKQYVSQMAIKEARKDLETLREANMKTQDDLESSMKEAELCLAEIAKAKKEFEQKLLQRANEQRLEMKGTEKLLLCITDKSKITKIEMLSIKNNVLKGLKNNLKHNFQQKKEEQKQCFEKPFQSWTEEKTEEHVDKPLEELLEDYVKTQHAVTVHKEKLTAVTAELTKACQRIKKRVEFLAKTEDHLQEAEKSRRKAANQNRQLRSQMEDYEVPDVKEYIEARRKFKRLQQDICTWERKVRISQMTLKNSNKALSSQKATKGGPCGMPRPTEAAHHQKTAEEEEDGSSNC